MFEIVNKRMNIFINKYDSIRFDNFKVDFSNILNIYNSNFLSINNCIFIEKLVNIKLLKSRFIEEDWPDFHREDFENHFHIKDMLNIESISKKELYACSLLITDLLRIKLGRAFPDKNFAVIVQISISNSNSNNDARISFFQIIRDEFDITSVFSSSFSELKDPIGVCIV